MKLGGRIDVSIVFLCIVRILSLLLMIPHDLITCRSARHDSLLVGFLEFTSLLQYLSIGGLRGIGITIRFVLGNRVYAFLESFFIRLR